MKKRSSSDIVCGKEESGPKYSIHSLQNNLDNLALLQQEHRQRLEAVEKEYNQLNKFKNDYIHLQKRLKTLPDKTSHEVMVPIGPLAFMPGRLIHTNEILVLLGDHWFAERSAKEAVDIVKRRLRDCDEKIQNAETSMNMHKNWLKETSDLFEDTEGQVEIIEELTEEEFEKSKEDHQTKKAEEYEKRKQTSDNAGEKASGSQEDFIQRLGDSDRKAYESIMRRLDQLEIEEDEESLDSQDTEDDDREYRSQITEEFHTDNSNIEQAASVEEEEEKQNLVVCSNSKKKLKRRVSWADDMRPLHTVIPDEESEHTYRIKYSSRQLSLPLSETENVAQEPQEEIGEESDEATSAIIKSPSDIYKFFGGRRASLQDTAPRGILKKTISNPESQTGAESEWNFPERSNESNEDSPTDIASQSMDVTSPADDEESLTPAFTYKVLERDLNPEGMEPLPTTSSAPAPAQNKKISRFKASRMK